jgi:hypothetical protein
MFRMYSSNGAAQVKVFYCTAQDCILLWSVYTAFTLGKPFWRDWIVQGGFIMYFWKYFFQHSFICHHLESTMSENAGIKSRTFATMI